VLFGRCLLADIALQALYIHFNRIAYWRHKVLALYVRRFLPFFAQTGHSEVLPSPKKSPTYGGEPKTPRIWAFLAKPFRTAF
jgi:hypothetical protein